MKPRCLQIASPPARSGRDRATLHPPSALRPPTPSSHAIVPTDKQLRRRTGLPAVAHSRAKARWFRADPIRARWPGLWPESQSADTVPGLRREAESPAREPRWAATALPARHISLRRADELRTAQKEAAFHW